MNSPLLTIIQDRIAEKGWITVADYMELALYHPQYGYYMTRDPFGVQGDFTTAPEISQMFGEMLGVWIADAWMQMGTPSPFQLVECGAGRGTLMKDVMRVCKNVQGFHESIHIKIIECSPVLRHIQKEVCAGLNVQWLDNIAQIDDMPCMIIGNEFLDALPIRQFIWTGKGWLEKVVVWRNGLAFDERETPDIPECVKAQKKPKINVPYEVSPAQKNFVETAAFRILKNGGAMLMIDYGYTQGLEGNTLQAVKDHGFVHPLANPGECDLTTHVDFSSIVSYAQNSGLTSHGIKEQGAFLMSLGIESRARVLTASAIGMQDKNKAQKTAEDIEAAKRRLITPQQMGGLFKAACFSGGFSFKPAGF